MQVSGTLGVSHSNYRDSRRFNLLEYIRKGRIRSCVTRHNVVRLYRGREIETDQGSADLMAQHFPDGVYQDVPGLCKVATLDEIEAQGWSLNPGRYVGVAERDEEDFDFAERLQELHAELEVLNAEAHELEERIADNVMMLLEVT